MPAGIFTWMRRSAASWGCNPSRWCRCAGSTAGWECWRPSPPSPTPLTKTRWRFWSGWRGWPRRPGRAALVSGSSVQRRRRGCGRSRLALVEGSAGTASVPSLRKCRWRRCERRSPPRSRTSHRRQRMWHLCGPRRRGTAVVAACRFMAGKPGTDPASPPRHRPLPGRNPANGGAEASCRARQLRGILCADRRVADRRLSQGQRPPSTINVRIDGCAATDRRSANGRNANQASVPNRRRSSPDRRVECEPCRSGKRAGGGAGAAQADGRDLAGHSGRRSGAQGKAGLSRRSAAHARAGQCGDRRHGHDEGQVEDLKLVSGDPMLAPAAMDAVRQWRYTPYSLNGKPIPKQTRITISFIAPQ